METKTNKLNARDFIFIGIFTAVCVFSPAQVEKVNGQDEHHPDQVARRPGDEEPQPAGDQKQAPVGFYRGIEVADEAAPDAEQRPGSCFGPRSSMQFVLLPRRPRVKPSGAPCSSRNLELN